MQVSKTLVVSFSLGLALLAACGKKESGGEEKKEAAAPLEQGSQIDPATVGTIEGKVLFSGEKPKLAKLMMDQDPVCVQRHPTSVFAEDGEVNSNGTLPNVFIYVKDGADKYSFATPTEAVELDQDGCMYKPHVLGVQTNQTLRILTKDPTTHNIHPMPKDNREWNMSQPPGAAPIEQKFARPEIMIPVKCNQHPWMRAYIGVTRNPFYGVSGTDGTFTIKGIPPGDYTLEAWTATYGTQELKVTVAPKETKSIEFSFKARGAS